MSSWLLETTLAELLNTLNEAMSLKAEKMFKVNDVSEDIGKCLLTIDELPEKYGNGIKRSNQFIYMY